MYWNPIIQGNTDEWCTLYILLHYRHYPQLQTWILICLPDNMWILPLPPLIQLKYLSTMSLYLLLQGKLVLVECFQLWKLPLSGTWQFGFCQKKKIGSAERHVGYMCTFTWLLSLCLWLRNSLYLQKWNTM